jgi:hypothetical protein
MDPSFRWGDGVGELLPRQPILPILPILPIQSRPTGNQTPPPASE